MDRRQLLLAGPAGMAVNALPVAAGLSIVATNELKNLLQFGGLRICNDKVTITRNAINELVKRGYVELYSQAVEFPDHSEIRYTVYYLKKQYDPLHRINPVYYGEA